MFQMATGARSEPEAVTHGTWLALRGRAAPGLAERLIVAMGERWRHRGCRAIVASVALDDGRWSCLARIYARDAAEDHLQRVADAGCLLLGAELGQPQAFFELLDSRDFRACVWRSLLAGKANPKLTAEVLSAGL
jgi:hypothetical protein